MRQEDFQYLPYTQGILRLMLVKHMILNYTLSKQGATAWLSVQSECLSRYIASINDVLNLRMVHMAHYKQEDGLHMLDIIGSIGAAVDQILFLIQSAVDFCKDFNIEMG